MPASMIVGRSEAKAMAESISSYYQEGVGLPSKQTSTVDATTMQVCVVNGQVVSPFVEGATLP